MKLVKLANLGDKKFDLTEKVKSNTKVRKDLENANFYGELYVKNCELYVMSWEKRVALMRL
jgi:hypothetical protein